MVVAVVGNCGIMKLVMVVTVFVRVAFSKHRPPGLMLSIS